MTRAAVVASRQDIALKRAPLNRSGAAGNENVRLTRATNNVTIERATTD